MRISTRTPLVGSDTATRAMALGTRFQPALPLWGVTPFYQALLAPLRFQPALPLWGVTPPSLKPSTNPSNFNPHSPCGE